MSLNRTINSLEPLWWSLFGLGGAIAAFILPAHLLIQGILAPMGLVSPDLLSYERMAGWAGSPIVKLYLLAIIVFPLFHAVHRIRLTLEDLRSEGLNQVLPVLCYGGAAVLSVVAVVLIFSLS
ncbi:MAG: fumarate reductase subunit D [Nitrospirae bacterium]|nr:fumarate reductase subunit D [Nitrospirota bacterium]